MAGRGMVGQASSGVAARSFKRAGREAEKTPDTQGWAPA